MVNVYKIGKTLEQLTGNGANISKVKALQISPDQVKGICPDRITPKRYLILCKRDNEVVVPENGSIALYTDREFGTFKPQYVAQGSLAELDNITIQALDLQAIWPSIVNVAKSPSDYFCVMYEYNPNIGYFR